MTAFPALCVQFGYRRILRVDVTQRLRGDATLERVWKNGHVQHIFEVPWDLLTAAERTTVDSFFQAVRGRILGDIVFVDPWDAVSYTCRFDQDSLDLIEEGHGRWGATIRLIEVADFKTNKSPVVTFPALASGAVVQLPYRMSRRFQTVVEGQEDDSEKRWEEFPSTGIQRWAVGGDRISDAEATALLNCFEGNGGPWAPMAFTEPQTGGVFSETHFVETLAEHELVAFGVNRVRLTVEQLA